MTNQDKRNCHGGRRHGLSKQGRTPALVVRLEPSQRAWLDEQSELHGVSIAMLIRLLIDGQQGTAQLTKQYPVADPD